MSAKSRSATLPYSWMRNCKKNGHFCMIHLIASNFFDFQSYELRFSGFFLSDPETFISGLYRDFGSLETRGIGGRYGPDNQIPVFLNSQDFQFSPISTTYTLRPQSPEIMIEAGNERFRIR